MDRKLPNGKVPVRKQGEMRSKFSKLEDAKLLHLVEESGKSPNWRSISYAMETRTPRQCRERYQNYLRPNIGHNLWTPQEDEFLLKQYELYGNKWNCIAKNMKGRTGNTIRNRFLSLYRRMQKNEKNRAEAMKKKAEIPLPPPEPVEPKPPHEDLPHLLVELQTPKVRKYVICPSNLLNRPPPSA
ncbi:Myb-like DNA-binding domain containing protein [Trichomonas vaginalis G3]|uniref:Myb-like DNA-binding domain containing protein n=1 Tax=Trichomonas vaginalis (strain ATCC PRA-98 / G3) TaxID=412133 RepID=A2EYS0_TRIV3|nr:RNA polymerase II transcription regulator recruiting protein [Trichomonas vaginalis G3]EAY02217.1 Myb-like DNA-binding domain containing protein [Trichomonas vaginalis G3]KAI5501023.1 RNA polymerase II transcription regulator recruiting protein [Trichomonas vaginalis G3]|eukprot:XP_001314555.1 Myb-like DNA-binding domain containing protein [Trichomonas vaginalis G3]